MGPFGVNKRPDLGYRSFLIGAIFFENRLADSHKSFIHNGLDCVPRPRSTEFLII